MKTHGEAVLDRFSLANDQSHKASEQSTSYDVRNDDEKNSTSRNPVANTKKIDFSEILDDPKLDDSSKSIELGKLLCRLSSNGNTAQVKSLLQGRARNYIDLDYKDEGGATALIQASCFGHFDVVKQLLDSGASPNNQDNSKWTALMWASNNGHKDIMELLVLNGASENIKSAAGFSAADLAHSSNISKDSKMASYLQKPTARKGAIGDTGVGVDDDWYDKGFEEDKFEEQMQESERRRRMFLESSLNLEVDLSSMGIDDDGEDQFTLGEDEDGNPNEFVWNSCLHDQMFVCSSEDINIIFDVAITKMQPQRSSAQKPIPANLIFLAARYAHYYDLIDLREQIFHLSITKITAAIEKNKTDMTILSFWLSNVTLLLYYLKKDAKLASETASYQLQLSELLQEIFTKLVQDAKTRISAILDASLLDSETITGMEDLRFEGQWSVFKSRSNTKAPQNTNIATASLPGRRASPSPRNLTSLLSSIEFILEAYEVHSMIILQVIRQIFLWLGAEIFNRILSKRIYHCRSRAMQIRLNLSALEDWLRTHMPYMDSDDSKGKIGQNNTVKYSVTASQIARDSLGPAIQLLQWLQCLTSVANDADTVKSTIEALDLLNSKQLVKAAKEYRFEVGEPPISSEMLKRLPSLKEDALNHVTSPKPDNHKLTQQNQDAESQKKTKDANNNNDPHGQENQKVEFETKNQLPKYYNNDSLYRDTNVWLDFVYPTMADLVASYGSGIGGVDREGKESIHLL